MSLINALQRIDKHDCAAIVFLLLTLIISFSGFFFGSSHPITSGDPAIMLWLHSDNAVNLKKDGFFFWDQSAHLGRPFFTSDIFQSPFSLFSIIISFFSNPTLAYSLLIFAQFAILGLTQYWYARRWLELQALSALMASAYTMTSIGFLNEYMANGFSAGLVLLPLMLHQINTIFIKGENAYSRSIIFGIILFLSHWSSNIATAQFCFVFCFLHSAILALKNKVQPRIEILKKMIIATFVPVIIWIGLFSFYLFPLAYEIIEAERSHLYGIGGGFQLKKILLWFTLPYTQWTFIDEMMITTGFLTYLESLNGYQGPLLASSLIFYFLKRKAFNNTSTIFPMFLIGFLALGWINNYIPILDIIVRIFKLTGWHRMFSVTYICSGMIVGIVLEHLLRYTPTIYDRNTKIFRYASLFMAGSFAIGFLGLLSFYCVYLANPKSAANILGAFSLRPTSDILELLELYYFASYNAIILLLIPATFCFSLYLFQYLATNRERKVLPAVAMLTIYLIGAMCLSHFYYPLNTGVSKTKKLKENEFLQKLGLNDRIAIIFHKGDKVEALVDRKKAESIYSLSFKTRAQRYPEVTRFQSNITMDGSFFRTLGPAVYTRGSNFIDKRSVRFHEKMLAKHAYFSKVFSRQKAYMRLSVDSLNHAFLDYSSINYIMSSVPIPDDSDGLKLAFTGDEYMVYENLESLPRVFFPLEVKVLKNEKEILNALENSTSFDKIAYLEEDRSLPLRGATGIVENTVYENDSLTIDLNIFRDGLVVINDSFHENWHAKIGENETPIYRVNSLFRGVWIPKGKHRLSLSFQSPLFAKGSLVSICVLLSSLMMLALMRVKKTKALQTSNQ